MSLVPQMYMDSVVCIGCKQNNTTIWSGTGFIVAKEKNEGEVWLYLITNKHVVDGEREIWIKLHNFTENRDVEICVPLVVNGQILYSAHPNCNIDIVAINLNGSYFKENNLSTGYIDIEHNAMDSQELREHGVSEGNIAYMLGYPMRLVNVNSKSPICRMGCIARMTKEQLAESNNILMDIQNFPGNSGSAVVLKPELTALEGTANSPQSVLIGIIHSYIPYRERLLNLQTNEIVEERTENSGLANMHPVEYIRDVVEIEYEKKNKKMIE